jgi:hypothetical protein
MLQLKSFGNGVRAIALQLGSFSNGVHVIVLQFHWSFIEKL